MAAMKATELWLCQIERVSQRECLWADVSALSTLITQAEPITEKERQTQRERSERVCCSVLGHCDPINNPTAARLGNFSLCPKGPWGGPLTTAIIRGRQRTNVPGMIETEWEKETDKMYFSSQCLTVYILRAHEKATGRGCRLKIWTRIS